MHRIKISGKPKTQGNYVVAKTSPLTQWKTEGTTLTGVRKGIGPAEQPAVLTIPEYIDEIDHSALEGWDSLQRVCFYDTAYKMGAGVFADCPALESAVLAEGTQKVPVDTFSGCQNLKHIHLPDTVRRINMEAFKNCSALKEIAFPESLEVIELYAFWGCRSLEEISLPKSVTELGDDCFASCTNLKKAELPDSLKSIGFCAFMNCISLEEIVIPAGVTELPLGVFAGCKNLRRVVLPETVESIHPYAFYRCKKLEQVEHPAVERFANALEHTPFWRIKNPDAPVKKQLPMELLNIISGPVSGAMLSAMGYHWFEVDREYRIVLTGEPGVFEVCSRYPSGETFLNDRRLMNEHLEPIPGIEPLIGQTDLEIRQSRMKRDAPVHDENGTANGNSQGIRRKPL